MRGGTIFTCGETSDRRVRSRLSARERGGRWGSAARRMYFEVRARISAGNSTVGTRHSCASRDQEEHERNVRHGLLDKVLA